jgi:Ca2+-binding EF-hand superfamily protein
VRRRRRRSQPKALVDNLFDAFDVGGRGAISEAEFCCGLAVMLRGPPDAQLRLLFEVYDVRRSGFVERERVSLYGGRLCVLT